MKIYRLTFFIVSLFVSFGGYAATEEEVIAQLRTADMKTIQMVAKKLGKVCTTTVDTAVVD